MSLLDRTLSAIAPADPGLAAHTQRQLDGKTKPRGSLGKLEALACQIVASRGTAPTAPLTKAIVVMAADHGVAEEGVSAYPAEVTRQMVLNFVSGGAAINALARHAGAELVVVDMGVRLAVSHPLVLDRRIGPGTASIARGPAMTVAQARAAIEAGITVAGDLAQRGIGLIGLGEMGIANTTSASALTAALTGAPSAPMVGRGTGIDDAALAHKRAVVERALQTNRDRCESPLETLAALGGFEIAGLAGVALGAASHRIPVVLDGFISSVAGLVAARLSRAVHGHLIASHRSVEPGHGHVLAALEREPLLDLQLRLGEGTGAALAMGLVDAALRVLSEMATFAAAGVSDSGA